MCWTQRGPSFATETEVITGITKIQKYRNTKQTGAIGIEGAIFYNKGHFIKSIFIVFHWNNWQAKDCDLAFSLIYYIKFGFKVKALV